MADITNTSGGEWPGYGESFLEPDHGTTVSDAIKGKVSEVASAAGERIDDAKAKVQEWSAEVADAASSVKQGARDAANLGHRKRSESRTRADFVHPPLSGSMPVGRLWNRVARVSCNPSTVRI
jgi:hypothetical protein